MESGEQVAIQMLVDQLDRIEAKMDRRFDQIMTALNQQE
jgi:hypothetical protein